MPPIGRNIQLTLAGLVALFVLQLSFPPFDAFVHSHLLVSASDVLQEYRIWTLVTYAVWHGSPGHIFANGLTLFFFGGYVEAQWSSKRFWLFSLLCALGSGISVVASQLLQAFVISGLGGQSFWVVVPAVSAPTLGYSGVVIGLLAAFAYFMWDQPFNLFFSIRMTGKTFFFLIIAVDLFRVCAGSNVSLSGHLGGLVAGILLTHFYFSDRAGPFSRSEPTASDFQEGLLAEAREALESEDFEEAYRLCHQLRSTQTNLPSEMRDAIWEILAIAATRLEKFDEAETYLERAPDTAEVRRARSEWNETTQSGGEGER